MPEIRAAAVNRRVDDLERRLEEALARISSLEGALTAHGGRSASEAQVLNDLRKDLDRHRQATWRHMPASTYQSRDDEA